jgi:U3 small nucleolar RNA-associated protein 3
LDGKYQDDEDVEDDEVFALKGLSEDDSDEQEEDEDDDGDLDMEDEPVGEKPSKSKSKSSTKKKTRGPSPTPSQASDSEEEESWGKGRGAYYASNAAEIESDDEEGNALEEQEAMRLQGKTRAAMVEDDFGLADAIEGADAEEDSRQVRTDHTDCV